MMGLNWSAPAATDSLKNTCVRPSSNCPWRYMPTNASWHEVRAHKQTLFSAKKKFRLPVARCFQPWVSRILRMPGTCGLTSECSLTPSQPWQNRFLDESVNFVKTPPRHCHSGGRRPTVSRTRHHQDHGRPGQSQADPLKIVASRHEHSQLTPQVFTK